MSKSPTITEDERLEEIHPGDLVKTEFVEAAGLTVSALSEATGISPETLDAFLDGHVSVSVDIDMRLGHYFRMSPGFFLGLQNDYDMRVWQRAHASELDRYPPRAA